MVEIGRPVFGLVWVGLIGMMATGLPTGLTHASPDSSQNRSHPTSPDSLASTDLDSPAIQDLRIRIQQDPTHPGLHLALGKVLESIGDVSGAIVEYTEALRLNPNDSQAFYFLSHARRSQRIREEERQPAPNQLDREPAPLHQDFIEGRALMVQGKFSQAVAMFRRGLLDDSGSLQGRQHLAEALLMMGEVDGAIEEFRSLIRMHPTLSQPYLRIGAALMVKQEWSAAKDVLEKALRLDPTLAEAHYNLGNISYTLGNVAEALTSYRQALAHNPDFPDAHLGLGLMLKIVGKSSEAIQEFQSAAELGVPQAEYFLSMAYQYGTGVPPDLSKSLYWLFRASEHGIESARTSLGQLRREALGLHSTTSSRSRNILQAFHMFRDNMWNDFPNLVQEDNGKTLGMTLLQGGRVQEGIPVLIREASALSEESHQLLEHIYVEGIGSELAPYDQRIMIFFQQAAGEGLPRPRMMLARIYGAGLGVESDREKAVTLLRGHPDPAAQRLLQELLAGFVPTP